MNLFLNSTTIPLPLTDSEDGPRIILIRPGRYDPKEYSLNEIFKIFCLFTDYLLLEDDHFIVGGQVGIIDLTNVTNEHFVRFTPEFVKKMTLLHQDGSPSWSRACHYVNTPSGFEYILNMFKTFMSDEHKKLVNSIAFHQKID